MTSSYYSRPPPFGLAAPLFLQSNHIPPHPLPPSQQIPPPFPVLHKMLADLVSADAAICKKPHQKKPQRNYSHTNNQFVTNNAINGNRLRTSESRATRKLNQQQPNLQQPPDHLELLDAGTFAGCRLHGASSLMELLRQASEGEDNNTGRVGRHLQPPRPGQPARWVREEGGSESSKSSLDDRWTTATDRSGTKLQGDWEDFYGDFARQSGLNSPSYESASTSNHSAVVDHSVVVDHPTTHTCNRNSWTDLNPATPLDVAAVLQKGGAQFTVIANVPSDTVRQDLVFEFRKFGRVELAMVVCDEASRHPHKEWTSTAGYAFVRFSRRSEAAAAIQAAALGLITIRGTRVRADWARKDSYAKRGRGGPPLNNVSSGGDLALLARMNRSMSANNVESKKLGGLSPTKLKRMTTTDGRINSRPPEQPDTEDHLDAVLKEWLAEELGEPRREEEPKSGELAFVDTYGDKHSHSQYVGEGDEAEGGEEDYYYLSPCSKRLLMIALKDVAATCGMANANPLRLSPEELLHRAVEAYERTEELGRYHSRGAFHGGLSMAALAN